MIMPHDQNIQIDQTLDWTLMDVRRHINAFFQPVL